MSKPDTESTDVAMGGEVRMLEILTFLGLVLIFGAVDVLSWLAGLWD